jgi:bifunctional DNase/RNase
MFIEAEVTKILENPLTKSPFILLKEKKGERKLTINIGLFEAAQLSDHLEGIIPPRPRTVDLFSSLLLSTGYRVSGVFIEKNNDAMYFANVELTCNEKPEKLKIDSRPSDALTIALKENAPVFVHTSLLTDW